MEKFGLFRRIVNYLEVFIDNYKLIKEISGVLVFFVFLQF